VKIEIMNDLRPGSESLEPIEKELKEKIERKKDNIIEVIEIQEEKIEDVHERIFKYEQIVKLQDEVIQKGIDYVEGELEKAIDTGLEKKEEFERRVKATLDKVDVQKFAEQIQVIDEITGVEAIETVITLVISPKQRLGNFSVYEQIPKSIANDISEVIIYTPGYEVVDPDPLIVWNFANIKEEIEVSYGIKGSVSAEEIAQSTTLPVGDVHLSPSSSFISTAVKFLPFLLIPFLAVAFILSKSKSGSKKK